MLQPLNNTLSTRARGQTAPSRKQGRKPFQFRYPTEQIVRFQGNGNYTWIYPQNKPRELLSIHLKKLGELYPHFKRVHKSHLINPHFIRQKRTRTDGYGHPSASLELEGGERVPWSRRYYQRQSQL